MITESKIYNPLGKFDQEQKQGSPIAMKPEAVLQI